MNEFSVDQMDVTVKVYEEAFRRTDVTNRNQTLYIWNVKSASYDYVICDTEDAVPDIVESPFTVRHFIYKEKPHE